MNLPRDPRDDIRPGNKEWEEFRAVYAAAFQHVWLLRELGQIDPDYHAGLRRRLIEGIAWGQVMAEDEGDAYPAAWLDSYDGSETELVPLSHAKRLRERLFPYRPAAPDFAGYARGFSVVALHASLGTYCAALGITKPRTPLPIAIKDYLASSSHPLDADDMRLLTDCDETRHLYVHHRGVVTERYAHALPYNEMRPGELRTVNDDTLDRFATVVWNAATAVRDAARRT